ncbi:MAG: DNA topoisomerase (ATP-hydrolyzing) [Planctomycetota bacterium]
MARKKSTKKKTTRRKKKAQEDAGLFDGDGGSGGGGLDDEASLGILPVSLHEAAQTRYLNYSLSVITSRALPDVRDGLKPVQRRILYTMWQQGIKADAKHRKCAKVVGDVMGNYHPHGDSAIYDALARQAQPWVMRQRLVEGSGNFGSIDGDKPAAMRYTECRLDALAGDMLGDISRGTVHFRPNYDGTKSEPVVLPSKVPNLLVNGSAGIAVGMATNIPPHNLGEVCKALLKVLDNWEIKDYQLISGDAIQGPDFPTGGQVINSQQEVRDVYKTGSGTLKVRGTTKAGPSKSRSTKTLIVDSIPYNVVKANLVEQIAQVVLSRKMPLVVDVKDLSTDDVRIELELKKDADEQKVLAYLYKHTSLQTNFSVNLTMLVPTENPEVGAPQRCSIVEILRYFLIFRHDVVTRRLEHELASLEKRIHILEGFALIFDALDEIIKIIRRSDGKADAAEKIMKKFKQLDVEQTDAILELKLYRLAKLEINLVLDELKDKKKRQRAIKKLLADDEEDLNSGRWGIVRDEVKDLLERYGGHARKKEDPGNRRTKIESVGEEPEFSAEDFIVAEDAHVLITADGWVKRQKEIKDPMSTRIREGDRVLACVAGSTRSTVMFFSSLGVCYTARIIDIPATTGYGEPIQKLFKLKDGEKIIAAYSADPRVLKHYKEDSKDPDACPYNHAIAASSDGYALRFSLEPFVEASTKAGRKYARPKKGQTITHAYLCTGHEVLLAVTEQCRAMVCKAEEVNYLSGPGKGVMLVKLGKGDRLIGFKTSEGERDLLRVKTNRGAEKTVSTAKYRVTGRGGKGWEIQKNGRIAEIVSDPVISPAPLPDKKE